MKSLLDAMYIPVRAGLVPKRCHACSKGVGIGASGRIVKEARTLDKPIATCDDALSERQNNFWGSKFGLVLDSAIAGTDAARL